jgi:hypothetical protein
VSSSKLTPEEEALLAGDAKPQPRKITGRPSAAEQSTVVAASERGPVSPAQYDDDGWGGLPVQMRNP